MSYDDSFFYEYRSKEQLNAITNCEGFEILMQVICFIMALWATYNIVRIIKYHIATQKIKEKTIKK